MFYKDARELYTANVKGLLEFSTTAEREKRQKDLGETKRKLIRLVKLIQGSEK